MFDDFQICPYTGLRSFTEEESIYFKGREENIEQAIEQLQRNKFLMLTGASGDGKSSLVYAGIIPNARAGFLRSKYTNWVVADFRPERTPFKNLCKSLSEQLEIENTDTVESELKHGFSALIDLYKNSPRHLDPDSAEWKEADDAGKAALKRKSANLMILVDQFEEFFTNPENYQNGAPSRESNLVLNVLLETSRIALEEDLPIYVVFTMRSDFIGQCSAFRGLPEYIGFSQFFVPRLNRTQLQQVVEEPAVLSGNKISRRLTERLIYDLTEGVDQLPILQHALNQIWHAANNGKEEMDLIHYAMVGGMPADELPRDQKEKFQDWFNNLPEEIRNCYHEPGLQNVLDTHTNKLYLEATEYYERETGKPIPVEDVRAVIKTAFSCLTKIDQSRAVRNRMTLQEITDILNRPGLGSEEVGAVLNIFREPGNTFIRPFIAENAEDKKLKAGDVLDITHESLIRNWHYLEEWALEEYEDYTVYLDFEKQLNRWVNSDKSSGYLLSIGPLVFFEGWYERVQPNKYWISRYLPDELGRKKKLEKADQTLSNIREFLQRSARRHVVTRTFMKYGAKKVGAVVSVILLLCLGAYGAWNVYQKQNSSVLEFIKEDTIALANRPNLVLQATVPSLVEMIVMDALTIPEILEGIRDTDQKVKVANGIASNLILQGRNQTEELIFQSLETADNLLEGYSPDGQSTEELTRTLQMLYDFTITAEMNHYYMQNERSAALVQSNAERSANWALHILSEQPEDFSDIQHLHLAIENGLNNRVFSSDQVNEILSVLSPFEPGERSSWVIDSYPPDRVLIRGAQPVYGNRHNGLYQMLAYLYAAADQPGLAIQSVDSILVNQSTFFENDYNGHSENATHIAAVFYTYNHLDALDRFVDEYSSRANWSPADFYDRLVSKAYLDLYLADHFNYYAGSPRYYGNPYLKFSSDEMLTFFFAKMREDLDRVNNSDTRNYNLALSYKNEGILKAFRNEIRMNPDANSLLSPLFDEAVAHYRRVSGSYLNQTISTPSSSQAQSETFARKHFFLFPDMRMPFYFGEPRARTFFYNSAAFPAYLIESGIFEEMYSERDTHRYFEFWMQDYHATMVSRDWLFREPIASAIMGSLADHLQRLNASESADLNLLYIHLADAAFNSGNSEVGLANLRSIETDRLLNSFQYSLPFFINTYSLEMVAHAVANATLHGEIDLAFSLIDVFQQQVNRSSLYGYASQRLSLQYRAEEAAVQLIDSARTEMLRLDNPSVFQPNRLILSAALMYQDPENNRDEAYLVIKNSFNKFNAMRNFSKSHGFDGEFYEGISHIPDLVSSTDRLSFYYNILHGYNTNGEIDPEWETYYNNQFVFIRRFLPYIPEGS
jgi:energy-coupling factor transporter ATP-binding protein EcfA2